MTEAFIIPSRRRRLMAYVYDLLPLVSILFLAGFIAIAFQGGDAIPTERRLLFQLYLLAWAALYYVVCWTYGGQTVGMRAWHLHLVTTDGRPASAPRMLLRFLLAVVGWLPFGLGHLWLLFDERRRSLHDLACRTLVIQEDPAQRKQRRARKG